MDYDFQFTWKFNCTFQYHFIWRCLIRTQCVIHVRKPNITSKNSQKSNPTNNYKWPNLNLICKSPYLNHFWWDWSSFFIKCMPKSYLVGLLFIWKFILHKSLHNFHLTLGFLNSILVLKYIFLGMLHMLKMSLAISQSPLFTYTYIQYLG
jgi:hypothetical protein